MSEVVLSHLDAEVLVLHELNTTVSYSKRKSNLKKYDISIQKSMLGKGVQSMKCTISFFSNQK